MLSQNSQEKETQPINEVVKAINFENTDGVFISFDLMDNISLKMIERKSLIKENKVFGELLFNEKEINSQLVAKYDISVMESNKYKELWSITEVQKTKLFESLEKQKTITDNVKKNLGERVSYISEEVFLLASSPLPC